MSTPPYQMTTAESIFFLLILFFALTIIFASISALVLLKQAKCKRDKERENAESDKEMVDCEDEKIDLYTDIAILEDECPDVPFSEDMIKRPDPTMKLLFLNLAIIPADGLSTRLKIEFPHYSEWERMHYINTLINELGISVNCGEFLQFIHETIIHDTSHHVLKMAFLGIKMIIVAYENSGKWPKELAERVRKFGVNVAEKIIDKTQEGLEESNYQLIQCWAHQLAQFCDDDAYKQIMVTMVEKEMSLPIPLRKVIWGTAARNGTMKKIEGYFDEEVKNPTVNEDRKVGSKLSHLHYARTVSGNSTALNFLSPNPKWEDLLACYEAFSEAYTSMHDNARKYFHCHGGSNSPWQRSIASFTSDPIKQKRAELYFMSLLYRLPFLGFEDELIKGIDSFNLTHKATVITKIKHHKIIFEKIVADAGSVANVLDTIIPK